MHDPDLLHRLATDFIAGPMDGDLERMRSALAADAVWTVPGGGSVSGPAEGIDAIVERACSIHAGSVSIELRHVLQGWDKVALLLHNTGRRRDVHLDEQVVIVFTVEGGRIVAADNLISDVPGLDAYFAAT